jgi:hypothetical protein
MHLEVFQIEMKQIKWNEISFNQLSPHSTLPTNKTLHLKQIEEIKTTHGCHRNQQDPLMLEGHFAL